MSCLPAFATVRSDKLRRRGVIVGRKRDRYRRNRYRRNIGGKEKESVATME
jgi:hypothetical protein